MALFVFRPITYTMGFLGKPLWAISRVFSIRFANSLRRSTQFCELSLTCFLDFHSRSTWARYGPFCVSANNIHYGVSWNTALGHISGFFHSFCYLFAQLYSVLRAESNLLFGFP